MKMSPSSEVEILIFLIVLKFKIIVENDTFFLGKLLLISHYFFCEKCQYALIVSAFVMVDPVICDSGTLSPSKKILCFLAFGEGGFP